MRDRFLSVLLTGVLASGLVATGCGDDGDEDGAETTSAAESDGAASAAEEKVVIKTRVTLPKGEVLAGSAIGEKPFCPGGTFRDEHSDDHEIGLVDRTIRCPDGTVRIGFSPEEPQGNKQTGPWKVISGTGAYQGLQASGEIETVYERGSRGRGRETFTGTAVR